MAMRVGTSAQALQYLEEGVNQPRAGTLGKLAGVFGVPIDAFFANTSARGGSTDR
jgi:transcriptional regulator with XRE-family HTH domain